MIDAYSTPCQWRTSIADGMNRVTGAYLETFPAAVPAVGRELPLEPAFGGVYGTRMLSRPLFVPEPAVRRAAADLRTVVDLVASLPDRLFDGDRRRLCAWLGIDGRAADLACAVPPGAGTPLYARPDLYYDGTGFRLLELNAGSELGGVDWAAINDAYLRLPDFRRFAAEHDLGHVDTGREIATYLRRLAAPVTGGADPVVALADISKTMATYHANYVSFVEHMADRGIDIRITHIADLVERDGRLHAGGTPVDVVMRYFTLEEFCAEPRAEEWLAPVLRAQDKGTVVFFASFDHGITANKGCLALVSQLRDEGRLSAEEAAAVDRIVPWTRRLTPDLLDRCRAERRRLVLKPGSGSSGAGVTAGWEATDAEWDGALTAALAGSFVVQERVDGVLEPVPDGAGRSDWLPVWGVFVFEHGYAGTLIRVSRADAGAVVNEATGSAFSCAFTYPEPEPDPQ
ncbi:hypothetical protein OHA72_41810 [Dactylosporangium sp. NBC_01737]|uniref:hypothetical protein n=1 Tax=Dactylosporangium sp. NBC_01737 TaxID=2975959 RepID=UPI002E0EC699|nr:hypothetical protein OHA72_41810 [Dactylosporangium sp. NBC_01737]